MAEDYTENILDSLRNISYSSLYARNLTDYIAGESTRVMNTYSTFIGTEKEGKNYKAIYLQAQKVSNKCQYVFEEFLQLKDMIQDLLDLISGRKENI